MPSPSQNAAGAQSGRTPAGGPIAAPASEVSSRLCEERERGWFRQCAEGLFRIDLEKPLDPLRSHARQVDHVLTWGRITECNEEMGRLLGGCRAALLDSSLDAWKALNGLLIAFVANDYEVCDMPLRLQGEPVVANATGVFEDGRLVRIWGRCYRSRRIDEAIILNALELQKQRIGMDLHDGVGQLLTAVRLTSHEIIDALEGRDEDLRGRCMQLADEADEALGLLREITTELSPAAVLRGDSLKIALEMLAESTRQIGTIECALEWEGTIRVPEPQKRIHIYRIVQEAVNNAVKHAGAALIQILVRRQDGFVELAVRDDGVGFEADTTRQSLGLESLRHRSDAIGASLRIESALGRGTSVTCRIPDVDFTYAESSGAPSPS